MSENKIILKTFFRMIKYGLQCEYHRRKLKKLDAKYQTVFKYHLDMYKYYCEKIFDEDFSKLKESKLNGGM